MNDIISGIYKIEFPNHKVYIGLTCDLKRRIKEHNPSAFSEVAHDRNLPVHLAIQKYGRVTIGQEVQLLEEIDPNDRDKLNNRESYRIEYYHATNKEYWYNLTSGGDGSSNGIDNNSAKLNQQTLQEIYDLLINHPELYIYQIAKKYNISPEAISGINTGARYFNSNLTYPLRENTTFKKGHFVESGTKNHLSKFSEQDVDLVYDLLLNHPELSLQEIGNQVQVSGPTISNINQGKRYVREGYDYPLRKTRVKRPTYKFNNAEAESIRELLKKSPMTFKEIANEFNCSVDTIKRLNSGQTYYNDKWTYPIRIS